MEAPLAERIRPQKTRLYKSIPPSGPNGSLTQQIAKELSLPSFYGDRREQENNFGHRNQNALLYILSAFRRIFARSKKGNKVEVFSPPRIQFIYR
jgi:hypothetical protein